mmetsp:Transcript_146287/g.469222  ORF Transcript_146287/g.469222 Transcript_146287/m.469222 type:complete len:545 (-) Transcript_146287:227-1861(-)
MDHRPQLCLRGRVVSAARRAGRRLVPKCFKKPARRAHSPPLTGTSDQRQAVPASRVVGSAGGVAEAPSWPRAPDKEAALAAESDVEEEGSWHQGQRLELESTSELSSDAQAPRASHEGPAVAEAESGGPADPLAGPPEDGSSNPRVHPLDSSAAARGVSGSVQAVTMGDGSLPSTSEGHSRSTFASDSTIDLPHQRTRSTSETIDLLCASEVGLDDFPKHQAQPSRAGRAASDGRLANQALRSVAARLLPLAGLEAPPEAPAIATSAVVRGHTWSCEGDAVHGSRPPLDRSQLVGLRPYPPLREFAPQQQPLDDVGRLEEALATSEAHLQMLEEEARALCEQACAGLLLRIPEHEAKLQDLHDRCLTLSQCLEDLAADALEFGCERMEGAMEVFNRANVDLERLAGCLQLCRKASADLQLAAREEPVVLPAASAEDVSALDGGAVELAVQRHMGAEHFEDSDRADVHTLELEKRDEGMQLAAGVVVERAIAVDCDDRHVVSHDTRDKDEPKRSSCLHASDLSRENATSALAKALAIATGEFESV